VREYFPSTQRRCDPRARERDEDEARRVLVIRAGPRVMDAQTAPSVNLVTLIGRGARKGA